jgi:hypothetical protein
LALGGMVCKRAYDYIDEQFGNAAKKSKKEEVVEEAKKEETA